MSFFEGNSVWFVLVVAAVWKGPARAQVLLVPPSSTWRYLGTGTNLGAIWRNNMPVGTVSTTALAFSAASDETTYFATNLSPALLRTGTNILAVEVHQVNRESSDVSFDLFLHAQSSSSEPGFEARRTEKGLELAWLVGVADWELEEAPTLTGNGWIPLNPATAVSGVCITTTLNDSAHAGFYRLRKP